MNGQLLKDFLPADRAYAVARFTLAEITTKPLIVSGVKSVWLDGMSVELKDGAYAHSIPPGNHFITIEIDAKNPAPFAKVQCDDAIFLGD